MSAPTLSIIVPCYNEQEALPIFYREVTKVLHDMNQTYEIIFIDDGSKDDSLSIMKNLVGHDDHVNYISFSRNLANKMRC